MPKLDPDIYGADDLGEANRVDLLLDTPDPTLDVNGETDSRAKTQNNVTSQG